MFVFWFFMVRLNNLKGLFPCKWFYDSVFLKELMDLMVLLYPPCWSPCLYGKIPRLGVNLKIRIWVCCIFQGRTLLKTFSPWLGNSHCQHRNAEKWSKSVNSKPWSHTIFVTRNLNTHFNSFVPSYPSIQINPEC